MTFSRHASPAQTALDRAPAAAPAFAHGKTSRYRVLVRRQLRPQPDGRGPRACLRPARYRVLQRRLGADLKARELDSQVALARALGGGYDARAQAEPQDHTKSAVAAR